MTTDIGAKILRLNDAGKFPAEIAAKLDIPAGRVYHVLRAERPRRERKPRERTSDKPAKVLALYSKNIKPARIAFVLGVSRAYVYRILGEA